jgi:hypothetical protein
MELNEIISFLQEKLKNLNTQYIGIQLHGGNTLKIYQDKIELKDDKAVKTFGNANELDEEHLQLLQDEIDLLSDNDIVKLLNNLEMN